MIFRVNCVPYSHDILFALDEDEASINKYLRQALHMDKDTIAALSSIDKWKGKRARTVATTYDIDGGPYTGAQIIRYDDKVMGAQSIGLLVHEIVHACSFILRRCGVEHTEQTEEAYTYLIQHVTEVALLRIGKQWWG